MRLAGCRTYGNGVKDVCSKHANLPLQLHLVLCESTAALCFFSHMISSVSACLSLAVNSAECRLN